MTTSPGRAWRWARRLTQCVAILAIVLAPFLGGWQRLDRAEMATWDDDGWNLPVWARDALPLGDRPGQAYDSLILVGGGLGVEYAGIPAIDPVAGLATLLHAQITPRFAIALAIPILLALLGGRLFCGWMCPFGVIARGLEAVLERLPWHRRRRAIPDRRPLRWLILLISFVASALGVHIVLLAFLPHLLVQQSLYSVWLLGGGGVVLALFLGLLVAAVALGPTVYCATLCPTGALFSFLGRKKLIRLEVARPSECGSHCSLCDNACWLQLHPASGDPGPDCDSCARCVTVCPQTNLEVAVARSRPKRLPVISSMVAGVILSFLGGALTVTSSGCSDDTDTRTLAMVKPDLIFDGEVRRESRVIRQSSPGVAGAETRSEPDVVTVALSIVDQRGIKLDPDSWQELSGVELSAYVTRGPGAFYRGPLALRVGDIDVRFDRPTSPRSTPVRSIYRRNLPVQLAPGTMVVIEPIPEWLDEPVSWRIDPPGVARSWTTMIEVTLGAALIFAGLLALALAMGPSTRPSTRSSPARRPA